MSNGYTLNFTQNPYVMPNVSGYSTNPFVTPAPSYTLAMNNPALNPNASIFVDNNNSNNGNNTQLTLNHLDTATMPSLTEAGFNVDGAAAVPVEQPTLMDEVKGNVMFGGAFAAFPLVATPFQSIKATGTAAKMIDGKAMMKAGSSAEGVAKAYSEAHRIARNTKSIYSVSTRTVAENDQIMNLLKTLRENHKKALIAGDKAMAEACANDMRTIISRAKKPSICFWKKPMAFKDITKGLTTVAESGAIKSDIKLPKSLTQTMKSAKAGAVIAVALEAPEVITAFAQGGAKEGLKQTGKSAVTATAGTAGWWAGAKVGGVVGAKVGAAIGAWFGGVGAGPGAAIGGLVGGLIGGAIGMWGANKAAKAVVGESFSEKQARMAQQNPPVQQGEEQLALNPENAAPAAEATDSTPNPTTSSSGSDLTKIADKPDEAFIKEVDALLTKYYAGTANAQEKAIVEARKAAAKAKVEQMYGPMMFNPMFNPMMATSAYPSMNPFAFC